MEVVLLYIIQRKLDSWQLKNNVMLIRPTSLQKYSDNATTSIRRTLIACVVRIEIKAPMSLGNFLTILIFQGLSRILV